MGNPYCSEATTLPPSLPPGCRFYPSKDQLLSHYLTNKNAGATNFCGCDLIRELDLFDFDPFHLPDFSCFSYGYRGTKRHWYFYTVRVLNNATRKTWKVKNGYWMRQGRVRNVLSSSGGGKMCLGNRTTFVFYLGNSRKNASRTNWMLYEYSQIGHAKGSFVVCRVFVKPLHRGSASENDPSSCGQESFKTVCHIGLQPNELISPDIIKSRVCGDNSIDRKNEIPVSPLTHASEVNEDQVAPASVSEGSQLGNFSGLPGGGAIFVEALTSPEDLHSILKEDFLELDDLV